MCTLYGDYFDSDSRAIASTLEMCHIKFDFVPVETLKEQHKEENYLSINRAGIVPTLQFGNDKIISGGSTFLLYLAG